MSHLKQKLLLEKEGVNFDTMQKIDFDRFLWLPDEESTP